MQVDQAPEDFLTDEISYERASTGKRFANHIVDLIVCYAILIAVVFVIAKTSPDTIRAYASERRDFNILDNLFFLFCYALFLSLQEAVFKGKTIGKFVTKTRAVNWDGSPITTGTAFARGFSRAVPFCSFSALGNPSNPWQDRWTNTMVINDVK